jgi:hypothetical protein
MASILFIAPFAVLANTLPFTSGGIGATESASFWFYEITVVAGGVNCMLLTRFFISIFALFGFFFLLK